MPHNLDKGSLCSVALTDGGQEDVSKLFETIGSTMGWYSINGTGLMLYGASQSAVDQNRVEFTSWVCILWVPLVPIRSYSALYTGGATLSGISNESLAFLDVQPIPHDGRKLIKTFLTGLLMLALCIGPIGYLIVRTDGRAATKLEMAVILALCFLPVYVVFKSEARRKSAFESFMYSR